LADAELLDMAVGVPAFSIDGEFPGKRGLRQALPDDAHRPAVDFEQKIGGLLVRK
jgi:hypothetical protein